MDAPIAAALAHLAHLTQVAGPLPQVLVGHLGGLHPAEKALTLLLAFGPFVLLAVVIVVRRRQDAAADAGDRAPQRRPGRAPGLDPGQDPDR